MAYITRQEFRAGQWQTWIQENGLNTFLVLTSNQIDEGQASTLRDKYLDVHLYDNTIQATLSIYDQKDLIVAMITFIKTNNPNLTQWNAYLASLSWNEALTVRWFLAVLAQKLAERNEVSLSSYTETEVLSKLKTFFINTSPRRLNKILFNE